jgi:hypothetical protein
MLIDEVPVAARLNQVRVSERAPVRTGVLHGRRGLVGKLLDRLLALGQEIEELDPLRAPERVTDPRELRLAGILEVPHRHGVQN